MVPREAPIDRAPTDWRDASRALQAAFSHPILQLKPHRLVAPASWAGHLPFAFWLVAVHRPRVIVELGTHAGTSYCGFCQAVDHLQLSTECFAIDTWRGDHQAGSYGRDVFEELSAYHQARYRAFSTLVRATFDEARALFADGSVDLIHVDGCHEYGAVRHDVEAWLPKLSPRGVLLLHDVVERRPGFGVGRLWDELTQLYPNFTFVHSHGLGVLAVGGDQSDDVRWLTAPGQSPADVAAIRDHVVGIAADIIEVGHLKDTARLLSQQLATAAVDRDRALQTLTERIAVLARQRDEAEARHRLAEADLRTARAQVIDAQGQLRSLSTDVDHQRMRDHRLTLVEGELSRVTNSKSWRLTAPLRDARRSLGRAKYQAAVRSEEALRRAYQRLPIRSQHRWAIKSAGFRLSSWFLRGTASYQRWQGTVAQASSSATLVPMLMVGATDVSQLIAEIRIPVVAEPVVSVIIPIHGQLAFTVRCLASIAQHLPRTPMEILIVDDQSPDASADVLSDIEGVRVLRNDACLGFIGSSNRGAREAVGRYLLFLNNDTVVQSGWCDELVRTLIDVPDCGIVGSKLVYPDGRLQEAGGIVWRDGSAWNYGRMDDPRRPIYGYRRDVDYVSGAALAVPRDLFLELGGFDARYAPAYYEDVDLAFKVREAGRRVLFQPRSVIVHHEGATAGRDLTSGIKAHQIENAKTFQARWRSPLAAHHDPGHAVARARERGARFRVLFLDHCTPEPDKDAGSGAVLHLFRILQRLGGKVTFIPEDNYLFLDPYTSDLQRMGVECLYAPFVTSVDQHLQSAGDDYDLVLMYRYTTAVRHLASIRRYARRAKVALLDVDLHFLREMREAELRQDPAVRERAERVKHQELAVIRQVDYTMVHSTVERDVLAREAPASPVAVFGWVADAVGTAAPYDARRDLLFVGGYQHPPNVDAVLHFVSDIFPRIRARLPDVRLYVVGSHPPAAIRELASEAVIVAGFVQDLQPLFDRVRVAIAPLRFGAGVKGKVATAMAHGVPSVATRIAAEGMDLVHGHDVMIADAPSDFADAVCEVYSDRERWTALSRAGLTSVEHKFSSSRAAAVISSVLDELGILAAHDAMQVDRVSSKAAYDAYVARATDEFARRARVEDGLIPSDFQPFNVEGFCANCGKYARLRVTFDIGPDLAGPRRPNWREQLICDCGLNCRMRVVVHALESVMELRPDDAVYLMEQTTPLYQALRARYPRLTGSEHLGDRVALGRSAGGIQNEDATRLTFADAEFDAILSFEVFEHIPDYRQAFRECARCLRPGGRLLFTAPFVESNAATLVRARIDAAGAVEHIEPPEYHGDPISPEGGILCFQHFGWDMFDDLKRAGFHAPEAVLLWSRHFGYLGRHQILFVATKENLADRDPGPELT